MVLWVVQFSYGPLSEQILILPNSVYQLFLKYTYYVVSGLNLPWALPFPITLLNFCQSFSPHPLWRERLCYKCYSLWLEMETQTMDNPKNTGAWKGRLKSFFVDPYTVELAKNGTNIIRRYPKNKQFLF